MKNLLLALSIGLLGSIMVINDAESRRLGGGKSFGRSSPSFQRSTPKQNTANQNQASKPTGANQRPASNSRRWLGPLAGLVAGGLIGAMLFGDLFEGIQMMDILLIGALIFGAVWFFRRLARQNAPAMQRTAAEGPLGQFQPDERGSGAWSGESSSAAEDIRPSWFNEDEFLTAAKTHFVRLQAAWDVADMADIRDFTTPQLFSQLTVERQSYDGEQQFTEVVKLDAELLGMTKEGDQWVTAVQYSGLIREEKDGQAEPFSEIWRVERDDRPNANWLIAGIEQSNGRLGMS